MTLLDLLVFGIVILIFSAVLANIVPQNDTKQSNCPPHKWEYVENVKTKDGGSYTGLYCKECKNIPNYQGRQ